jgi:hypothetical protein
MKMATCRKSGTIHRNAAGLNLEWRVSDDVALTYESLYQRRKSVGGTDVVLSTAYAVPRPIAGNSKLNSIGAGSDVEFVMYTLGMDVRWAPDWMFNLSHRTSDSTRVYKKDQYYITSDKGDYKDRVTSELHGYHFDQLQASWEGKLQKWGVARHRDGLHVAEPDVHLLGRHAQDLSGHGQSVCAYHHQRQQHQLERRHLSGRGHPRKPCSSATPSSSTTTGRCWPVRATTALTKTPTTPRTW